MKKILYLVTQSDFGGAQKYIYDLATNISKNYAILVAGGEQCYQGELAKKLIAAGICYHKLSHLKRAISPRHDFLAFWQIVKLIKKERPDIIHLNSSKISILGSLAVAYWSLVIGHWSFKVVYTVHGWVFSENLSPGKKYFYKILEKFTAKFKNKIICLSEFEKQNTIKNKIAPAEKISVIYNGIAPIDFLPRLEARKKLSEFTNTVISDETILIGSIGNLYKNKGYEYLIKNMRDLSLKTYDLKLTIIGSGPELQNLKSEITRLPARRENQKSDYKIFLTGAIPNAAQFLPAFDVYVCSSVKEGLPYTVLEAMQAGLPIVSTNVGAIPEIITDGDSGLLVEPKNPEALAEKIKYFIDNPKIAKQLGENAKEKMKKFSLEQMIKQTEELYKI
jgi:glycosyltransferase involved in cell wall biosynthesis